MWCKLDPEDLDAFIDGEVGAARAAEISAHVAGCASCRLELERARKIDDAVRRPGPGSSLSAMRAELLGRVAATRRRSLTRAALAAAAVVVAFLIGWHYTAGRTSERRTEDETRRPSEASEIEALELDAASLRLALVAEKPEPAVRQHLDARLDVIVDDIERLRATARSNK